MKHISNAKVILLHVYDASYAKTYRFTKLQTWWMVCLLCESYSCFNVHNRWKYLQIKLHSYFILTEHQARQLLQSEYDLSPRLVIDSASHSRISGVLFLINVAPTFSMVYQRGPESLFLWSNTNICRVCLEHTQFMYTFTSTYELKISLAECQKTPDDTSGHAAF